MTKSSQKHVPEARIDRSASLFPNDIALDRAMAPGLSIFVDSNFSCIYALRKAWLYCFRDKKNQRPKTTQFAGGIIISVIQTLSNDTKAIGSGGIRTHASEETGA